MFGLVPLAPMICLSAASLQTQSGHLVSQDFKTDLGGWVSTGGAAKVSLTHQSPLANGNALKFEYKVDKGEVDALILPAEPGSLTKAKSIKFRVMTDTDALLGVALQEKDGGRYLAFCYAPKGAWQNCELSLMDFHLAQEANDPKDPDGKLDIDQVEGIGIIDLGEMFASIDDENVSKLLHVQKGAHSLYVDQFSIATDDVATTASKTAGSVSLDSFAHPQLGWFGLGEVALSRVGESPLQGPTMKWSYKQENGKIVGASCFIDPGSLADAKSISFDLASVRGGTVKIQIEEVGGNKYSTSFNLPFESKPKHIVLQFSDFRSTDDTKDPNAKLNLAKVKSLLFVDQSGTLSQADAEHPDNNLWINHIVAGSEK